MQKAPPPITLDGRYFVVRGRLWRCRARTLMNRDELNSSANSVGEAGEAGRLSGR